MLEFLKSIWRRQTFYPSYMIGIWINPSFIIRRGLMDGLQEIAQSLHNGKLLDIGCGSKPYEELFDVEEYLGIDVEVSGHDHASSKVDKFYDGKVIPYDNEHFNHVFSSEVFEHVFNLDELFAEINRVLKPGGKFAFTCPFVWDEHEQPYDFARYTSFAIEHMLAQHGFKLIKLKKSSGYIETVMQMLSSYLYQHVLPKNNYIRVILTPILVAPINILGLILKFFLPKNDNFYHNNIVLAEKVKNK